MFHEQLTNVCSHHVHDDSVKDWLILNATDCDECDYLIQTGFLSDYCLSGLRDLLYETNSMTLAFWSNDSKLFLLVYLDLE